MTYFWFNIALVLAVALVISLRKRREDAKDFTKELRSRKADLPAAQAAHEREISRLLDAFPSPFFSISESGNIIRYNQAAASLFQDRTILNRSYRQVFIDRDLCGAIKEARETQRPKSETLRFNSKSPFATAEDEKQDSVWEVNIQAHSVTKNEREFQLLMRDITKATYSDQVRQDFVANASHELRTPLSIIVGYLENLLEPGGLEQTDIAEKMLLTMNRHVERINCIVEEMLVISRLESPDAAPLNIAPFNLLSCVHDVVEQLDPVIERQKATVKIDVPSIEMRGDSFYWTQILFNLVENALKQNASLPFKVTVTAQEIPDNQIQITVTDNGIGIPSADLPFIFKRFFRVEKHHGQNVIKGTGLGLSIVKRAIEAHQGTITAASTPGQKTTFRIVAPL